MRVIDLQGNEYPLQVTSTNDNEVNGNQSFSATIYPTKVNKPFISDVQELWTVVDHDDVEHKIIYCKRQGEGELMTAEVKAIPLFFDVLDNDRIYERIDKHMTAQEACTHIFKDTGFDFVLVDSFAAVQWEGFGGGETKLETFSRAKERYKWEFEIVGNIVYLKKQIGRDTSIQYRHKLNASNIVQEIDAKEMWTYAKGYGDYGDGEGGEDWQNAKLTREYTSPLANILGIRHAPPIKNGNITDTATMDKQLKTLVDESLKISVSADIHDLRKQGYPIAQSQVGDRVFLIDERIGLDDEVRVVAQSVTRDWKGNVLDISITFGSEGLAKRHQSNINTAVKDITDILSGKKELPLSALDKRVQEISKIINGNTDSVFKYMSNGVMGWNGDNPNYMTRYVGDAIGFSKDGGKTYGTAMSAELGIVADYITTGTLRSIIVEAVEIYGSLVESTTINGGTINGTNINGSTFLSKVTDTEYTKMQGAFVENRGTHTRTWRGKQTTHDVLLKMENGLYRARNNNKGWSLYLSDWGISTYNDATGNDDASGFIEFHSSDYSPSGAESGLSLYSLAGRIALETDGSRIYLNPNGASVRVSDINDNYYNIAAAAFSQSSRETQKRDIVDLQDDALAVINSLQIKEYKRLTNGEATPQDHWQAGIIVEQAPSQLLADGDSVDLYTYVNYIARSVQQLSDKVVSQ